MTNNETMGTVAEAAPLSGSEVAGSKAKKDTTPPKFVDATVTDNKLVLNYDSFLDTGNEPSADAFSVMVKNEKINVTDVDISKKKVTLTLEEAVLQDQKVRLKYTNPVGDDPNAIQDKNGNDAAEIKNTLVNNETKDNKPPNFEDAKVDGNKLVLSYSDESRLKETDKATPLPTNFFTVKVNGGKVSVEDVTVNGNNKTVTLTLVEAVEYQQQVTVSYQGKDEATAIQDQWSNKAANLSDKDVDNLTPDTRPPVFINANVNADRLSVVYTDEDSLDANSLPDVSLFTVKANGETVSVKEVKVDAKTNSLILTLETPVEYGQEVTLAYKVPGKEEGKPVLQDNSGNDAKSFAAKTVNNNTPDTLPPLFDQATINGTQLTLRYTDNDLLKDGNVPPASAFQVDVDTARGVAISENIFVNAKDKTVTLQLQEPVLEGQAVVLSYTDAKGNDANAIQDVSGNDAASLKGITVKNETQDITPPVFTGAVVNNTKLVLSYSDEARLDAVNLPLASAFTVNVDGIVVKPDAVAVDAKAKTVSLKLASPVEYQQLVTLAYKAYHYTQITG